ncbi:hypothetical protein GDO78_023184 [Eleutherodactylus coqui]|uniref:Galectin n=1 Tax=Eleutherodactylus coqui TaxID=57060 RepID=A0A8J6EFE6_ELECQ|nr:hypothetical protein GDO78_023184 [Eleutherodactylus coqui]
MPSSKISVLKATDYSFHFGPRCASRHKIRATMGMFLNTGQTGVSVNRRHFLQYRHRIPVHRVNTLTVTGCISLTSIEILAQGDILSLQLPTLLFTQTVPFQTDIYGGLFPNKRIIIKGAVINHANRFHASLKFSGGIAFYFNPRFDEHSIIRNSFVHNSWGREERQLPICGIVVVNGNHLCNFNHRMPRLQQIDSLLIEGDVVLQHVQV